MQTISYFFEYWLTYGEPFGRLADSPFIGPKLPTQCSWTKQYILGRTSTDWGSSQRFSDYVVKELGSRDTKDRLVVLEAHPNQIKGHVSTDL